MIKLFYREDLARTCLQYLPVDKYEIMTDGWVIAYTRYKKYSFSPGQVVFIEEDK